jgi:choline-glycine betaine transporter
MRHAVFPGVIFITSFHFCIILFCNKSQNVITMNNSQVSRNLNYYLMMYVVIFSGLAIVAITAEALFIK